MPMDSAGLTQPSGLSSRPLATSKGTPASSTVSPTDPHAPLMRHLMAQFAATGLPPAYLELDDATPEPNP